MATEGGGILWKRDNDQWKLGDYCQAIFSEDGLLYEACVMSTNEQEGTCVVHFLGYGNEEEVRIGDLLASQGKHARAQQELAAQGYFADNIDVENHSESMEWIGTRYGSLKPGKETQKRNCFTSNHLCHLCMSYRFSGFQSSLAVC
ncbi:survival motor neuron protein-like isoform X3 [Tachypleus tridentatus]|uniref:survival motor neuron protein-like isoform X3 n=1 Tax=Tachypleus tridentatus TaxID=6853 RepID=UPI003FCF5640